MIGDAVCWVARTVVRLAVRFCPEDFRSRYGDDLVHTHTRLMASARDQGALRLARVAFRDSVGAIYVAVRLRFTPDVASTLPAHSTRRTPMLETVAQDTRFAIRGIVRNPGFAVTVVAVLALGIGGVSAIFSVVNAYLFRPMPFADEDRIVMLFETNPEFGWVDAAAAPANALDWREQVDAFEDVALYSDFQFEATLIQNEEPLLLRGTNVSGNFFSLLGARPALGAGFVWDQTWAPEVGVIVLSHQAWVGAFDSDADIVGRSVELSGNSVQVLGVMPPNFAFPSEDVQFWTPWGWDRADREQVWFRRAHFTAAVARLAPGASQDQANAQLQVVVRRLQGEYPATNSVMGAGLMTLRDFLIRDVRTPLLILGAAVSLLLLLACTNVANLMLVRTAERSREVAVRVALGAGRGRIARQLLTESVLLALMGGATGMLVGWLAIRGVERLNPIGIEGATGIALDGRVVAVTLAVALVSGLLFGSGPALGRRSGASPTATLKAGGRSATSSRGRRTSANVLVGAEVALALLLVVGAGLVLRSFVHLRNVDPGFQVQDILSVRLSAPSARYPEQSDVLTFWDQLADGLEARPGIERVGGVGQLPLAGTSWSSQFKAEGWPADRVGLEILHRRADRGYFEALDIPLVRGRHFEPADRDGPLVIVVNEQFVAEHFAGEDPLGQRIAYDREPDENANWYEIVGVVGDQHQQSPAQSARAEVFENRDQDWSRTMELVIRTEGDPMAAIPVVRSVLAELDPLIPLADARPLRRIWRNSIAQEELILTLLGGFGLIALLIAAVGVYGVTAQTARRRTHEIGIRMALGAARRDILVLILRQGLGVVLLGVGVGLAVALVSTKALSSQLYGVQPNDPLTLAGVVGLLVGVAMVACYVPALRSTRVDPLDSLRSD